MIHPTYDSACVDVLRRIASCVPRQTALALPKIVAEYARDQDVETCGRAESQGEDILYITVTRRVRSDDNVRARWKDPH